jgi:hypothetical protein
MARQEQQQAPEPQDDDKPEIHADLAGRYKHQPATDPKAEAARVAAARNRAALVTRVAELRVGAGSSAEEAIGAGEELVVHLLDKGYIV